MQTTTINNQFELLKNGNVAKSVWANPTTKEIYPANRNSFGYNAIQANYQSEFYKNHGQFMKLNAPKGISGLFSYSANSMKERGFILVMRNDKPLF